MDVPQRAGERKETAQDCRLAMDRLLELRLDHWEHKSLLALWIRGYDRKKQDLSGADLASWIGAGKDARAHEAIAGLKELGALEYDDRLRGRYIGVWIVSLQSAGEDSDGPRRQTCDREGPEIPGEDWEVYRNPQAQTVRPVETLSIRRAADVPRGDDGTLEVGRSPPPEAPDLVPRLAQSAGFGPKIGATGEQSGEQSAGFGPKIGASTTTTSTSTSKVDLSLTSTSSYVFGSGSKTEVEVRTDRSAEFGTKIGACLPALVERLAAPEGDSLLTVAGLTAQFPAQDNASRKQWAEAAAIAIAEAETGGRGFGVDELADCVKATRAKLAAGTLQGPAWCFCRGAIQRKYRERGIGWPKFQPRKAR